MGAIYDGFPAPSVQRAHPTRHEERILSSYNKLYFHTIPDSSSLFQWAANSTSRAPESFHACPNETVTFTCRGSQIVAVQWKLNSYIEHTEMLSFSFS